MTSLISWLAGHPVLAGWVLFFGGMTIVLQALIAVYLLTEALWDLGHWLRQLGRARIVRKDLRQPAPPPAFTRRPDLIGLTDPQLPGVVHVIPFDLTAARAARERMRTEEAFYDTTWGENGRRM